MAPILTVSELTRGLKEIVEAEFPLVWVRGEATNLARPASGHVYFSLTDGRASLNVVWFKNAQPDPVSMKEGGGIHPLTGEVMEPGTTTTPSTLSDGDEVLCAGRLTIYEGRSVYQMIAEVVQAQGVGDLALRFEALKRDLAARGWFDEDRKMALPDNPVRVAVVTSTKGAAIRDFLRLAEARGTGAEIRIFPTLVQGRRAPEQIAKALADVTDHDWAPDSDEGRGAEVVVLIRGGGSMEDLWAFNTEEVARAMVECPVPIVTGIGHEPDVTIADYVADRRAATPSHAAQEIWPRRSTLAQAVDEAQLDLARAFHDWLERKSEVLSGLGRGLAWLSPARRLVRSEGALTDLRRRLLRAGSGPVRQCRRDLFELAQRLARALSPARIRARTERLRGLTRHLAQAGTGRTDRAQAVLDLALARLHGLNPEAPLARGYSLVTLERTGRFLRAAHEARPGDDLDIRTGHGRVGARVTALTTALTTKTGEKPEPDRKKA